MIFNTAALAVAVLSGLTSTFAAPTPSYDVVLPEVRSVFRRHTHGVEYNTTHGLPVDPEVVAFDNYYANGPVATRDFEDEEERSFAEEEERSFGEEGVEERSEKRAFLSARHVHGAEWNATHNIPVKQATRDQVTSPRSLQELKLMCAQIIARAVAPARRRLSPRGSTMPPPPSISGAVLYELFYSGSGFIETDNNPCKWPPDSAGLSSQSAC